MNSIPAVIVTHTAAKASQTGWSAQYASLSELKQLLTAQDSPFPKADLEDFRRAADTVRLTQLAAIILAYDTQDWNAQNTGLVGWNGTGCRHANLKYWQDYVANGKDTARASLFVPTLPSIPICEAAIALGIHGPTQFLQTPADTRLLQRHLRACLAQDPTSNRLLVFEVTPDWCVAFNWTPTTEIPSATDLKHAFFPTTNTR